MFFSETEQYATVALWCVLFQFVISYIDLRNCDLRKHLFYVVFVLSEVL